MHSHKPGLPEKHITMIKRSLLLFTLLLFTVFFTCESAFATGQKAVDLVRDNQPIDINTPKYHKLFTDLEAKGFDRNTLEKLFSNLTVNRKVLKLMDRQWGKPTPWYAYRARFLTPSILKQGKQYLRKFRPTFDRIEKDFGVNREVVVAIWAMETRFGQNTGDFNMFRSLNTLFAAYPRRSDFFRAELIDYLLLCRRNAFDPRTIEGSWAGAFGQAQFMPSSFNKHAVDYDDDGIADLIHSRLDVFASIANYLHHFGWTLDTPVFIDLGHHLHSPQLEKKAGEGWSNSISWQRLQQLQRVKLPAPVKGGHLTVVPLDLDPQKGGGKRYLAGYPNFQAVQHYNHNQKYAAAVSELAKALQ